jgi:hypothetical protein
LRYNKDITRSEQKSRQKTKAKRSSRKREHSLNDKSETRVFLAMKIECVFSKRNLLGSNHLLQQKKQNKTESESKAAPRKTHST